MDFVYDLTVDPEAENNTHAFALGMIGHNKSVLEVGCATGYFTKALARRGCKVVGIELDPEAAKVAEDWAERVVVGDVDDSDLWNEQTKYGIARSHALSLFPRYCRQGEEMPRSPAPTTMGVRARVRRAVTGPLIALIDNLRNH